jgi:hypothetical protein
MFTNKKLFSNACKLVLCTVLLSTLFSCNGYKSDELYTIEECRNLKKGDTIYTRECYTIKKQIVEKNVVDKELLELRDLEYTWSKEILKYDDVRFK